MEPPRENPDEPNARTIAKPVLFYVCVTVSFGLLGLSAILWSL